MPIPSESSGEKQKAEDCLPLAWRIEPTALGQEGGPVSCLGNGKGPEPKRPIGELGALLARQPFGEENLAELTAVIAGVVGAPACAVVLSGRDGGEKAGVFPADIGLTEDTPARVVELCRELARRVAADGKPLSLPEVELPSSAAMEHWLGGIAAVPLFIGGKTAGALVVPLGIRRKHLPAREVDLLDAVALLLGMSAEKARLHNLLQSRFAQMALTRERTKCLLFPPNLQPLDTERSVRIIAKTFYREMTRAGFGPGHIIDAATEIISQLGEQVKRHSRRQNRHS